MPVRPSVKEEESFACHYAEQQRKLAAERQARIDAIERENTVPVR